MDRRASVVAALTLVGLPASTRSQQAVRKRLIGFLSLAPNPSPVGREPASAHMRTLGWVEGQNLIVERRYAGGKVELLQPMVEELIGLKVEVIVANGTVASLTAKRATSSIPIVVDRSGDPVGVGLVASLARPGANITGTSTMSVELDVKRIEVFRELLPTATRFGVLVNPSNPVGRLVRKNMEQAFRSLQMEPIFVDVTVASELESAVARVARGGGQGLIVDADPLFVPNFRVIVSAAHAHSLPMLVEMPGMLTVGGLVSYGPSEDQLRHQLAVLIDKVLKGARPADLPIEQPSKLDLIVSLKSAKALGISVPKSLLLRADHVIE